MQEQEPKVIRQTIFQVQKEKEYTIDVDETTNIKELKKILAHAAHLRKNSFKIYHNDIEFTQNFNDKTIYELFPKEQKIYFTLVISDFEEEEEEDCLIEVNTNLPCKDHPGKFQIFYCYTCKQSICKNCLDLNHKNHDVKEKYDYLAPTKLLIERIFKDAYQYIVEDSYDNCNAAIELEMTIKNSLFAQLNQMIDQVAINLTELIKFFVKQVTLTKKNINENITLLKEYSIHAYKALKRDINTNQIIIDDDIFLTLDKKLKEIIQDKESLKENTKKFIEINKNIENIREYTTYVYQELFNFIQPLLNQNKINEIKNKIKSAVVSPIQKEAIMEKMFENVTVSRKSLLRSNNRSYNNSGQTIKSKYDIHKNVNETSIFNVMGNNSNVSNNSNQNEKVIFGNQGQLFQNNQGYKWTYQQHISNNNPQVDNKVNSNSNNNNYNKDSFPLENNNINNQNVKQYTFGLNNNQIIESSINEKSLSFPMNSNQNSSTFEQEKNMNMTNVNMNVNMTDNNQNKVMINKLINQTSIPQSINNNNIYQTSNQTIIEKTIKTNKTNDTINNYKTEININAINENQKKINIPNTTLQNQNFITQNNNLNPKNEVSKEIRTYTNKNISNEKTEINNPQKIVEQQITKNITTTTENGEKITTKIITKEINIGNNNITSSNSIINNSSSNDINNNNFLHTLNNAINQEINESKIEYINEEPPKTYIGDPNKNSTIKINSSSVYIFYPIPNTNRIIIETSDENSSRGKQIEKIIEFPITIELTKFLEGNGFCNYKNKIYISGGIYKNQPSTYFLKYDPSYKTIIPLQPMKISKTNHSMIGYNDKIYCVGGMNNNKNEYYDIKELKWELMPNLNVNERQFPMLYINKNFLYAFCGLKNNIIINTIERINLNNLNSGWNFVNYKNPDNLDINIYGCGIIPFEENSILLFGGKNNNEILKKVFKYNFPTDSFHKSGYYTSIDFGIDFPVYFRENVLHNLNDNQLGGICENEQHRGICLTFPSEKR